MARSHPGGTRPDAASQQSPAAIVPHGDVGCLVGFRQDGSAPSTPHMRCLIKGADRFASFVQKVHNLCQPRRSSRGQAEVPSLLRLAQRGDRASGKIRGATLPTRYTRTQSYHSAYTLRTLLPRMSARLPPVPALLFRALSFSRPSLIVGGLVLLQPLPALTMATTSAHSAFLSDLYRGVGAALRASDASLPAVQPRLALDRQHGASKY